MTLFTASANLPFGVAACIMIGLALIEVIGLFTSLNASRLFDNLVPESPDSIDGALGWLHVGKVPILVLLILLLFGFSVSGYLMQMFFQGVAGLYLPAIVAVIPASVVGVGTVRVGGGLLAHIIPRDETSAVSNTTLIGRTGVVITGTARAGMAAEVKIRDQHGNAHYLMLEPDLPGEAYEQGTEVLIVKKTGAIYRGIRNPHPALL